MRICIYASVNDVSAPKFDFVIDWSSCWYLLSLAPSLSQPWIELSSKRHIHEFSNNMFIFAPFRDNIIYINSVYCVSLAFQIELILKIMSKNVLFFFFFYLSTSKLKWSINELTVNSMFFGSVKHLPADWLNIYHLHCLSILEHKNQRGHHQYQPWRGASSLWAAEW